MPFFKACSVLQGLNSFHFSGYCSDSGSLCSTTLYWRMRRNVAGMLKRAGRSLLQCVTQQFNTATAGKADRWDCCKRKDAYLRECMCTHTPTNTAQHLNTFQHLPQNVREKYIFLCSLPPFIAVVNKQLAWTTGTRKERFSWHVSWLSTSLLYLYNVLYLSSPLTLTSNWIWRFPASKQLPGWSFPSPESSKTTRRVIPPGSKALPPAAAAQRPAQGEGSHPVLQLIPNQLLENNLEGRIPAVGWKHKPKHRMNRLLALV